MDSKEVPTEPAHEDSPRRNGSGLEVEEYTEAIKQAGSPEQERRLLSEKQAALHAVRPPRHSPGRAVEAEPDKHLTRNGEDWRRILQEKQSEDRRRRGDPSSSAEVAGGIKDTNPRRLFERSREGRLAVRQSDVPESSQVEEPETDVSPDVAHTGAYAHGVSMAATMKNVCMRKDITWRGKSLALVLAAHWPNVRPTNQRLMILTGHSRNTVFRGLAELKANKLLTWKRGKPRQANEYTCHWLPHSPPQAP